MNIPLQLFVAFVTSVKNCRWTSLYKRRGTEFLSGRELKRTTTVAAKMIAALEEAASMGMHAMVNNGTVLE